MQKIHSPIRLLVPVLALTCATAIRCQPAPDPLANARALLTTGKLADAESSLHTYLLSNPASADAHFLLGYILFRNQKAKESLAEFTAGARYRHPSADDLKIVASDYVLLGDFTDADTWFTTVVTEHPNDADAWYLLGRTKYNESDFPAAISSFDRALTLHPKYIEAENNRGLAFKELNQTDKARAAFQNAIDWQGDTPHDPQPFLNLGTLLADQSSFDKAVLYLTKAAELSPNNPTIHEQLGDAYRELAKLPQAQRELERAIALAPNASALHFKLGQIYRKQGLHDRAQYELDLCAKLNSSHSSTKTPNPVAAGQPSPK